MGPKMSMDKVGVVPFSEKHGMKSAIDVITTAAVDREPGVMNKVQSNAWPDGQITGFLPQAQFEQAVAALPLVSVDWVLTNPTGHVLIGQRLNAPARGTWFTPGGRVRKGEPLTAALQRVAREELGLPPQLGAALLARAQLMGAWDHFFPDATFSASVPTHYVNLPHWVALLNSELAQLRLPVGEQHSLWRWMPLPEAVAVVQAHVKPYVVWLQNQIDQADRVARV